MKMTQAITFWTNLIGYQVVWFISVIGASHNVTWPSFVAGGLFVVSQIATAHESSVELRILVVAIVFGIVIDGVAAKMDWLHYAAPLPPVPAPGAPLWILILWASFAMTINRSLIYLRDRWWLALVLGAIGAPLAYLGAQHGWHAVVFQPPSWRGVTWIAASWAVALPLLATLARCLSSTSHGTLPLRGDARR